MTRYESLAEKIETRIKTGRLLAGQKLPSVRDLSASESVSPTTVVEAYELLRDRGIIESRERSGYFVVPNKVPSLDPTRKRTSVFIPGTEANADEMVLALRLASEEPKIFPFGTANPLPDYCPTGALNRTFKKVLADEPTLLSECRFPPGSVRLREKISERYARLGASFSVDSILVTSGAIEALGLALSTVALPGETIAMETPMYFGILQLVKSLGYRIIEIPLENEIGLTPERFEEALKKAGGKLKALVTISSFSNPLGSCVPDESKKAIVEIAKRAGTVIIEDDIYGDLHFGVKRPKPYSSFDRSDTVITCGSFAKTLTPGIRVGYVCSKKHFEAMTYLKIARTSGVSALAEETVASFLETEHFDRHLKVLRKQYCTLIARYSAAVLSKFPAGTKISQPQGGFVLWIQLPERVDSRKLQIAALKQNISIAPGPIFSACHRDYVNFIRLNCAIPWNARAEKAIAKLATLVHAECK